MCKLLPLPLLLLLLLCLSGYCSAGPLGKKQRNMPIVPQSQNTALLKGIEEQEEEDQQENESSPQELAIMSTLTLPSNATSIRADITDTFSCDNKPYGYYADVDNDCQIFHVCLPVTYADGKENTFRWSFICPEETIFSQDSFTCMRPDDMTIECTESFKYYELNRNFGLVEEETGSQSQADNHLQSLVNEDQQTAMTKHTEVPQVAKEGTLEDTPAQSSSPSAIAAVVKPIKDSKKPAKPSTANRRKPASSQSGLKRKPTPSYQLRRVPVAQAGAEEASPQTPKATATEEEEENKLVHQKISKRPTTIYKPQKPNPVRPDLYNQVRKRPSYFNTKDTVATPINKPSAQGPPVEVEQTESEPQPQSQSQSQPELVEPVPTLKLESIFSPGLQAPVPKPAVQNNEDQEIQEASHDSAAQQSETAPVYVKPEEEAKPSAASDFSETSDKVISQVPAEAPTVAKEETSQTNENVIVKKHEEEDENEESLKAKEPEKAEVSENVATSESQDGSSHPNGEISISIQLDTPKDSKVEDAKPQQDVHLEASNESDKTEDATPEEPADETKTLLNSLPENNQQENIENPKEDEHLSADNNSSKEVEKPEAISEDAQNIPNETFAVSEEMKKEEEEEALNELKIEGPEPVGNAAEELLKETDAVKPIEAIEEIPALIRDKVEKAAESEITDEKQVFTDQNPLSSDNQSGNGKTPDEIMPVTDEETDEETDESSPTLEEMEEAKPVDAIEIMEATPQMQQHDPIVQAMFANSLKPSSDAFKPDQPEMAAAAEALITDFLSTLMKSENSNNAPIYPGESGPEAEIVGNNIDESKDDSQAASMESAEAKPQEITKEEDPVESEAEKESHEIAVVEKEPEEIASAEASGENKDQSVSEAAEAPTPAPAPALSHEATLSNMLMFNHFPDNMYHIPVKVITTPEEEENQQEKKKEKIEEAPEIIETADEEPKQQIQGEEETREEAQPIVMDTSNDEESHKEAIQPAQNVEDASVYRPLSIDDIVEMVKDRLDQNPTPVEETLSVASDEKNASEQNPIEENSAEERPSEEIIMPIYQRDTNDIINSNLLKAQNLMVNEPSVIAKDPNEASSQEDRQAEETAETQTSQSNDNSSSSDASEAVSAVVPSGPQEPQVQNDDTPSVQLPADESKSGRAFRSRSIKNVRMDPRKRRFLFRSDAS